MFFCFGFLVDLREVLFEFCESRGWLGVIWGCEVGGGFVVWSGVVCFVFSVFVRGERMV